MDKFFLGRAFCCEFPGLIPVSRMPAEEKILAPDDCVHLFFDGALSFIASKNVKVRRKIKIGSEILPISFVEPGDELSFSVPPILDNFIFFADDAFWDAGVLFAREMDNASEEVLFHKPSTVCSFLNGFLSNIEGKDEIRKYRFNSIRAALFFQLAVCKARGVFATLDEFAHGVSFETKWGDDTKFWVPVCDMQPIRQEPVYAVKRRGEINVNGFDLVLG